MQIKLEITSLSTWISRLSCQEWSGINLDSCAENLISIWKGEAMTKTGAQRELISYRMCLQNGTSSPHYNVPGRTDNHRIRVVGWNLASRSLESINSVLWFLGIQQHALGMSSHSSWGGDRWVRGGVGRGERAGSGRRGGEIPCLLPYSLPEISCLGLLLIKPNRNQVSQEPGKA